MLTIKNYNNNEKEASKMLLNRVIAAFRPVTFMTRSYPMKVYDESEIIRFIDTMHDLKQAKYYNPPYFYSRKETGFTSKGRNSNLYR